jgi:hypothetical protein
LNHFTVPVAIFFSKAHFAHLAWQSHEPNSTSSMSLEEEPAGPFNKAQRLSERLSYIEPRWYLQGAG